jgi:hypothetical protein
VATNVAARLRQLTTRLGELDAVIVATAGRIVHDALIDQLTADTGGDRALSGMAKGRYRLDVKLIPLSNPAGVRIIPANKQAGMWTLLDTGRSGGYTVAARRGRRHKRGVKRTSSRAAAMSIGGAWAAGPYTVHRSTSGHRTWSTGRDKGFDLALDAVRDALHEAVAARG